MENRNYAAEAAAMGVTTAALRFWVRGLRRPRPENIATIRRVTRGRVTEADFDTNNKRISRLSTTRSAGKPAKPAKKAAPKKAAPKKAAPAKKPARRAA